MVQNVGVLLLILFSHLRDKFTSHAHSMGENKAKVSRFWESEIDKNIKQCKSYGITTVAFPPT